MIAKYDNPPRCMPVPCHGLIQLVEDWCFTVDGVQYWIPVRYTFDGASIPRAFWWIIGSPFDPKFWSGALAHDWLYLTHLMARSTADEIFRQLLIRDGAGRLRSRTMWSAVRGFGAVPWKNGVKDQIDLCAIRSMLLKRGDGDKFGLDRMAK